MISRRDSRKIVAAIIGLGHSLDLTTVAEGVETEEQADLLLCLGCEQGQGWLYGRPSTSDRISDIAGAPPRTRSNKLQMRGNSSVVSSLEAQPAQRLAQLQAIYDGAPVGLCFLDRNLRYVSLNLRLADMNGAPVAAHLGRTAMEMSPYLYAKFEPYLLRAIKGESIPEVEICGPASTPGEADRTTLLSYQPAFDEVGEVIGVSVAIVDITERKRLEETIRESEDHHRHLVELNPEIPWVMDAEGNNLEVSSDPVDIAGLSKDRLRNRGWLEAVHPEDVEPTMTALREGIRTGKHIDVEYRANVVGRGWRWMRSRGSPRYRTSGEIDRWYGSIEDIHERRQLEEIHRPSRV